MKYELTSEQIEAVREALHPYMLINAVRDEVTGVVKTGYLHVQISDEGIRAAAAALPEPAQGGQALTLAEIDEFCREWGAPEYFKTDDGAAWYWRFPTYDSPVADNLSGLFIAAKQLLCRRAPAPAASGNLANAHDLLGEVLHLWIDGYISKNPKSRAPDEASEAVFNNVLKYLRTQGIEVDYCGPHKASTPERIEPFVHPEAQEQEHDYISTACHHGLHDRCRKRCKFCSAPCRCVCHRNVGVQPEAQPSQAHVIRDYLDNLKVYVEAQEPSLETRELIRDVAIAIRAIDKPEFECWLDLDESEKIRYRSMATASLRIVLASKQLHAWPEIERALAEGHDYYLPPRVKGVFDTVWLNGLLAWVRSKLHPAPVVASAEERVTIVPANDPSKWVVLTDRWNLSDVSGFRSKSDAEIYRRGLIADLKEKEQGK